MQNAPFTVAGMSSSTTTHHSPNLNTWGNSSTGPSQLGASFGDSLSQSRSHYQPGYLLSSQNNASPPSNPRVDEVPIIKTKAKMNHVLSRGTSASDFGMSSMFESTRQRKNLADEDAPPTNSVNDIPNEISFTPSSHFQAPTMRTSPDHAPLFARRPQRPVVPAQSSSTQDPTFIIVFGYPPEKYSAAVEFFQSLGATTAPETNADIQNCFRIGFAEFGDALRAVRKNGEILGGSWMVGAKWANQAQADMILSQIVPAPVPAVETSSSSSNAMLVDEPSPSQRGTPSGIKGSSSKTFGTPVKLAPASAAFRKHNPDIATAAPVVVAPQPQRWGTIGTVPISSTQQQQQQQQQQQPSVPPTSSSPNKSMLGQVSDLIFGW